MTRLDVRTRQGVDEAWLDQQVLGDARLYGWRAFHVRDSRRVLMGEPGYPDWTLASGGRTVFIECKSAIGELSPDQRLWLDAIGWPGPELQWLQDIGDRVRAYVIRPIDWEERRLRSILA